MYSFFTKNRRIVSALLVLIMTFSTIMSGVPVTFADANGIKSPVVASDGQVSFYFNALDENRVRVAGSFTDWATSAREMQQIDTIWSLSMGPLDAGRYEYKFIVGDNNWITDPLNPQFNNGNSLFFVPGVKITQPTSTVLINTSEQLKGDFITVDGHEFINHESINWSLHAPVTGVTLIDGELTISEEATPGEKITVVANYDGYNAQKTLEIVGGLNSFKIHYYRFDEAYTSWDLWLYGGGYPDNAYSFTDMVTYDNLYTFATGTYEFPLGKVNAIPRLGNWEAQDKTFELVMPTGEKAVEVWLVEGDETIYYTHEALMKRLTGEVSDEDDSDTDVIPHVRLTYSRADETYSGWDVWTWFTGIRDGAHAFTRFEEGKAIAEIPVNQANERLGFIVRVNDWSTREPNGIEMDRYIPINGLDKITKAYVVSGEETLHTVPAASAPKVIDGQGNFYFRDPKLYLRDAMSEIDAVYLLVNEQRISMEYDALNEYFKGVYKDMPHGSYPYSFEVHHGGVVNVVTDPYFSGPLEFFAPEVTVSGTVVPSAVNYNENAVLTVSLNTDEPINYREIFVDLRAVGGQEKVQIDPSLNAISLAVAAHTTAGLKNLPITAIDVWGNVHLGSAQVTVSPRVFTGENDFDWDEAIIYFLLTDRFYNGNPENDDPYGINYDLTLPGVYQGGDFKGITEKLDYLSDLGINTIWLNPIVENIAFDVRWRDTPHVTPYYGYHGYWASNFETLNPHFGTLEELHALIDAAHERGIKIMVDVVLNHVGYGLKAADEAMVSKPAYFPTTEDRQRFDGMLRSGGSDVIQGELAGLPDLMTELPEVRAAIIDWQVDWIKKATTAKGNSIDFFRVDTVKHVENTTWMTFKNALTAVAPSFKMIGESWGATAEDSHQYLRSGMMDSVLDFSFNDRARDFVSGELARVERELVARNALIDNTATVGQFISSHDEDRFLSFIGAEGNLGKHMLAASLQLTAKGQPVIYYGDELGLSGKNNYPYYTNRQNFPWETVDGDVVLAHYKKLLQFRNEHSKVFARGDRTTLSANNGDQFSLFQRDFEGEKVTIGLNVADEVRLVKLSVSGPIIDVYSNQTYEPVNGIVEVSLPKVSDGGTALLVGGVTGVIKGDSVVSEGMLRVHYNTASGNYSGLGLWIWGDVLTPSGEVGSWPTGALALGEATPSDYGVYVDIPLIEDAKVFSFLINNTQGANLTQDRHVKLLSPLMNEIWVSESGEVSVIEPVTVPEGAVRIHYLRQDGAYEPWGLWHWGDVLVPSHDQGTWPEGSTAFDNQRVGKYGAFIDIPLKDAAQTIGFLLVHRGGDGQSSDMTFKGLEHYRQLFLKDGDLTVYTNPFYVFENGLEYGELLTMTEMLLRFTSTETFSAEDIVADLSVVDVLGQVVPVQSVSLEADGFGVKVSGEFTMESAPYQVTFKDATVEVGVGWRFIDHYFAYDGSLGAQLFEDGSALLKFWSPKADAVSLILYDKDDQFEVVADDLMLVKGDRGVWSIELNTANTGLSSLEGFYYHYVIVHGETTTIGLDPYAKSMAPWSHTFAQTDLAYPVGKAAIVDPSKVGPNLSYARIPGFTKREDAIIYEVHVRDFTSDVNLDKSLVNQYGTFASFVEKLDYIEALGVTHIQLLPIMSYYFGNELASQERMLEYASTQTNYNWGYDPHSYFSISGMYTSDPYDATKRIEEFKELVDAIHERGMGVVLDVVYNHTARVGIFEDLVPNYYHFMDADGTPRTSFGGGRLGTTHAMARRILVDSILYWTEEFKIDGFRFDMMGDHDAQSIQIAFDRAKALNPNLIMIGEGWRTYAGDATDLGVKAADQDWMKDTEAVGSFSDEFRNELKSGFGHEGHPRFITGGSRTITQIFDNIKAQPHNFYADQPGDVVTYIAAHDNLTLHDVIAYSIKKDPAYFAEEIHKRQRIGNAMVLMSQGTAFLHAGQEYGRTKQFLAPVKEAPYKSTYMVDASGKPFDNPYFIHDSYDSSDSINRFDWQKATDENAYPIHTMTRSYTAGLIALRRSSDAFTLGSRELVDRQVTLLNIPEIKAQDLVIAYRNEATNGDAYYVFVNADNQARQLSVGVDLRAGKVLVDSDEAGVMPVKEVTGFTLNAQSLTLEPLTVVVILVPKAGTSEPVTNPDTGSDSDSDSESESANNTQDSSQEEGVTLEELETPLGALTFERGFIKGYTDNTFRPDVKVTRAEFAKMLAVILDLPITEGPTGFSDSNNAWFSPYVLALREANIMKGYDNGLFKPQDHITRAEIAVALVNAWAYKGIDVEATPSDLTDIARHYAYEAIAKLTHKGIVSGYPDGTFRPNQTATRAETVKLLNGFIGRKAVESSISNRFSDVQGHWAQGHIAASID